MDHLFDVRFEYLRKFHVIRILDITELAKRYNAFRLGWTQDSYLYLADPHLE